MARDSNCLVSVLANIDQAIAALNAGDCSGARWQVYEGISALCVLGEIPPMHDDDVWDMVMAYDHERLLRMMLNLQEAAEESLREGPQET